MITFPQYARAFALDWGTCLKTIKLPGFKRSITVRGTVIVDRRGYANFVASEPIDFWTFWPVFAVLSSMGGAILGLAT